jgi:hypothetical protein
MVLHRQKASGKKPGEGLGEEEAMNYGESLAYWYFRLNGFLPMTNFVLHEPDQNKGYNSDSDLLAVRFPYVFEEIGGKPEDWDNERFDRWSLEHFRSTILVIAEVKSGVYKKSAINKSFSEDRLRYALQRFGVLAPEHIDDAVRELLSTPVITRDRLKIVKVLVNVSHHRPSAGDEGGLVLVPCYELDLRDALYFIDQRMKKYAGPKGAARMFFPGDLIQFLAWNAGVRIDADTPQDG